MALQAYIDDSQADEKVLVMAGYISDFSRWEKFSTEWQFLLDGPPRWERFKMVEVAQFRDQRAWERAGAFYRAVETYAEAFVAAAIELEALEQAAIDSGIVLAAKRSEIRAELLTNAYVIAHRSIIDATLQHQGAMGLSEPIDFVFDEFRAKKYVEQGWRFFVDSRTPEQQPLLGRQPRFACDDDLLPLQAADMLAWHAREHWLQHGSLTKGELVLSWEPKKNPRGYRFNIGYETLLGFFQEARERAETIGLLRPALSVSVRFLTPHPSRM